MLLNLRDVGGIAAPGGRTVRSGVLLRSAAPTTAFAAGAGGADAARTGVLSSLRDVDARTVVDLRDDGELARDVPIAGDDEVRFVRAPIETSLVVAADAEGTARTLESAEDLGRLYLDFLDRAAVSFAEAARTVARAPGATLVHCTLGKDRTGVATALLLSVAGVANDLIVRDYARTNEAMPGLLERIHAMIVPSDDPASTGFDWSQVPPIVLEAPETAMHVFLAGLVERGGADAVLRDAGLGLPDIEVLRTRLVG